MLEYKAFCHYQHFPFTWYEVGSKMLRNAHCADSMCIRKRLFDSECLAAAERLFLCIHIGILNRFSLSVQFYCRSCQLRFHFDCTSQSLLSSECVVFFIRQILASNSNSATHKIVVKVCARHLKLAKLLLVLTQDAHIGKVESHFPP